MDENTQPDAQPDPQPQSDPTPAADPVVPQPPSPSAAPEPPAPPAPPAPEAPAEPEAEEDAVPEPEVTEAGWHEFLGAEETWAEIGPDGHTITVSPGDVVEIPAGNPAHLWKPAAAPKNED